MKFFVFMLLAWFCTLVTASEALLIPVTTPEPEYPQTLLKERYTGKVLVNLTIGAFGTVQSTRIIESSHPMLAEAVQHAVVKWRYQPWDVTEGRPGKVDISVPILFGALGIEPFSKEITVGLENTLCAYLNYEVKSSQLNYPKDPLSMVDVFWHTRDYLAGSYVGYRVPDPTQRKALFDELKQAVPAIVKACKRNPKTRYSDHLPAGIRRLLASQHSGPNT